MNDCDGIVKQAGLLADDGKPDEAVELCNKVLALEPDNHKALYVMGSVLKEAGHTNQAYQLISRVCTLRPQGHQGWEQLALICGEMHRYDDSIRYAEKALSLRREAKTLADCAYAYTNCGQWQKGRQFATESLKIDAEQLDAKVHVANCDLALKNWRDGWKGYRLTQRTKYRKEWQYGDSKQWRGEADAILMVTGEQGLGDEMMAASVVPDACRRVRKFILDCDHRLAPLFRRSFPDALVVPARRMDTVRLPVMPTHHETMFSLAEHFRNEDSEFPRTPYLMANPAYVSGFRAMLDAMAPGRRWIGLAWSGGFPRTGLAERTAGLSAFLPLIRRGEAEFVSLQYKDDSAEVAEFMQKHGLRVHRFPWATQTGDMDLVGGFVAALDEIVGVHTTALHLSSAIGIPTTILTHRGSGWRYGPDELLWYPTTTQMHKKRMGESWRECVDRLVERRKERAAA
jgi:hypothetical protein